MKCDRWNDPLFIKYLENNVSLEELIQIHNHFNECPACYERFIIPLAKEIKESGSNQLQKPYPSRYQVLAVSLLIFVIVGIGIIYQLAVRPWYQAYLDKKTVALSGSPLRSDGNRLSRYDLINIEIGNYLSAMAKNNNGAALLSLASAQKIADEMLRETGERSGLDLVDFYRKVPKDAVDQLREARKLCAEAEEINPGDDYAQAEEKATASRAIFEQAGSKYETANAYLQIIRVTSYQGKHKQILGILDNEIDRALKSQYLLLQAKLLFLKGVCLGEIAEFSNSISTLEKSVQEASRLDVPRFIIEPIATLVFVYYIINENSLALEKGIEAYQLSAEVDNKGYQIQLGQVLGLLECGFSRIDSAKRYIELSIELSDNPNQGKHLIKSYAFLGVVLTEEGNFSEAETYFEKAVGSLDKISSPYARKSEEAIVMGYFARSQMLAGRVDRAIEFYRYSLDLSKQLSIDQKLMLSQLHQGLGESLKRKGDMEQAQLELAMARKLENEAKERCETNNALLTFAVSRKIPERCN
jgi:tetratricopeptide (TPR) repeat protein